MWARRIPGARVPYTTPLLQPGTNHMISLSLISTNVSIVWCKIESGLRESCTCHYFLRMLTLDVGIVVDVEDADVNADDQIGIAVTTVRDIMSNGQNLELTLVREREETGGRLAWACQFFKFEASTASFSASEHKGDGLLCGVITVLIAGASGIKGQRQEIHPSVVVTWGEKNRFQTVIMEDAPGTDINNPAFDQSFRIHLTTDLVNNSPEDFRIALLNGDAEVGAVNVPYANVLKAPELTLRDTFDIGDGTRVKASICVRGITTETTQQATILPERIPNTEES